MPDSTNDFDNAQMRAMMLDAAENQIAADDPPETRLTLERLMGLGFPREEAMQYIANVLTMELLAVLHQQKPFNEARYVAALKALPERPWEG